jgi:O-acetylserine/cysteine efflux transporter
MQPTDILLALLTVMIWGMNFVVIKIGLAGLPPLLFSALRFVFAALPLVFFVKRPAIPWRLLIGFGLFQFALQFSLLFSGMQLGIGAGLASLVVQLQAFFTIGLAVLLLGERPLLTQLLGALVALAGIALVATHLEAQATVIGFLLVIGAGLSWASANIVTKKIGKVNSLALMTWGSLMAAPPLLLASALLEGPAAWHSTFSHFGWISVAAVFYQSYPNTIVGYGIWTILMRKYPAATVAPFSLLVPLVGMVSAAILLGESLQWWKIVAGMLVLGGLALNQFGGRLLAVLRHS